MMVLSKQRTAETMSEADSRVQHIELLERGRKDDDRIIIERDGVPIAAIVPSSF